MGYEILPHTADFRIRAWGKTHEELFADSLRGMSSVMRPEAREQSPTVTRDVSVASADTVALLIDFLSEALSLAEIHKEIYTDVQFHEFDGRSLRAAIRGLPVPEFSEDVKAVTYHGAEIRKADRGYEVTVTYDV